jgi:hypothetical protein
MGSMISDDSENEVRHDPVEISARVRSPLVGPLVQMLTEGEELVGAPLVGVTTDGTVERSLFDLQPTGVPTTEMTNAATDFLAALDAAGQAEATRPLDSDDWRRWSNLAPNLMRHGALLEELTDMQRERALGLMQETLSARGFATARDIMKLNHSLAEMTGHWYEYDEWLYWLSIFGTPSPDGPWGWQLDGHHLIVNCLVIGDRIVTTPMFWGAEPVTATTGRYAGTTVFEQEEQQGYALLASLTAEQRAVAVVGEQLPPDVFTSAFRDNFEMRFEGVAFGDLTDHQQSLLLRLVEVYVGRTTAGHAAVKMAEVTEHLDRTYFAWIGGTDDRAAFYYRIHSPVILIEFDHLPGRAFRNTYPTRRHIHTVVRTPNGNDYGKDLLRLHHEQAHPPSADAAER